MNFESRLERALRIDIPAPPDAVRRPPRAARIDRRTRASHGWLALAASLLVAVVAAGGLWLALPGPSLAAAVVAHMAGEPAAWQRTAVPVSAPQLAAVLRDAHMQLRPTAGLVSYANSCAFRGHQVPHLVVQSATGPVTVMVLAHETTRRTVSFDEQGYRGMIVPVEGHGSLAVLARGDSASPGDVGEVAKRVLGAIEWSR